MNAKPTPFNRNRAQTPLRNRILRQLRCYERQGQWREALSLFNRMVSQLHKPDAQICTKLLRTCYSVKVSDKQKQVPGRSERIFQMGTSAATVIDKAVHTVQRSLYLASEGTFRRILLRLHKSHQWDAVLKLYANTKETLRSEEVWGAMNVAHAVVKTLGERVDKMWQRKIRPDNKTLGSFIKGATLFADWERLRKILGRGRQLDLTINEEMYGAVIKACNRFGDFWLASAEFLQMRQDGIEPTSATIEQALIAMCRAQQWKQALDLEMEYSKPNQQEQRSAGDTDILEGSQTKPTHGGLIEGSSYHNLDLQEEGYNYLIRACGYTMRWQRALELYSRMEKSWKLSPDYDALLEALMSSKQYNRALEFGLELAKHPNMYYIGCRLKALLKRAERLQEKNTAACINVYKLSREKIINPFYDFFLRHDFWDNRENKHLASTLDPPIVSEEDQASRKGARERVEERQPKVSNPESDPIPKSIEIQATISSGGDYYTPFARVVWGAMEDELQQDERLWEQFSQKFGRQKGEDSVKENEEATLNISLSGPIQSLDLLFNNDSNSCTYYQQELDTECIPWPKALTPSSRTQKIAMRSRAYFEYLASQDVSRTKRYLRRLILRWHPDKFMRRFKVPDDQKPYVLRKLHVLSVSLNNLLLHTEAIGEAHG
mmetsp:Transcript_16675/g.23318  ORF Transcript_16675/g.23318 Transcript_16675/m.23318 type:complete len:662 (+) Transcript_16675:289-2274(+)